MLGGVDHIASIPSGTLVKKLNLIVKHNSSFLQ